MILFFIVKNVYSKDIQYWYINTYIFETEAKENMYVEIYSVLHTEIAYKSVNKLLLDPVKYDPISIL